ncbi:hypothetical protein [Embleya sp. AB8]|uniref:hypothetical protein n=1 Tax=Embleya sp. AB8 TaxID=3156304 RepID=UPI003C760853
MGTDITVLVVDWARVEATPVARRLELLQDAAYANVPDDADWWEDLPSGEGWLPSTAPDADWYAEYVFRLGGGSYKPHFWTGEAWEVVREFVSPAVRAALDTLLSGLVWNGLDGEALHIHPGIVPDGLDPYRPHLHFAVPPRAVLPLAAAWTVAEPQLDTLREPFAAHIDAPGRWIENFEEFEAMVRGWGEVVTECARRGWGIVGLP